MRGLLSLMVLAAAAWGQRADYRGYKDPEILTRMPGFVLSTANSYKEAEFGAYEFRVQSRPVRRERVEGRVREWFYRVEGTAGTPVSPLQILRNYQNAVKQMGGKVVYEDSYRTTMVVARGGAEVWIEVDPGSSGVNYGLVIVEKKGMVQVVVADAAALGSGLAATGHVEVAGILFDFNKAEVKAESAAAIAEVAKLMAAQAGLKVWVVGHTDNVGTAEGNVALSNARAAAVVAALVKLGVGAGRMGAHGAGPYAPVASNVSEEGRAKNRRVELVAQP